MAAVFEPPSNEMDLSSVAESYNKQGKTARAPAKIAGKSGIEHKFALAVLEAGEPRVVADTALSVSDVDETRVLAFYVKVFDVGAANSILCVAPRLNPKAKLLANQYGIVVLESEEPRKLVPLLVNAANEALSKR